MLRDSNNSGGKAEITKYKQMRRGLKGSYNLTPVRTAGGSREGREIEGGEG